MAMFQYTDIDGATFAVQPNEIIRFGQQDSPEISRITFDAALVTANEFDVDINTVSVPTTVFNSDNDTTLDDIVTNLLTIADVFSAVVVDEGSNPKRSIDVTGVNSLALVFANELVTEGASQAGVTITETQAAAPQTTIILRNRDELVSSESIATLITRLDGLV